MLDGVGTLNHEAKAEDQPRFSKFILLHIHKITTFFKIKFLLHLEAVTGLVYKVFCFVFKSTNIPFRRALIRVWGVGPYQIMLIFSRIVFIGSHRCSVITKHLYCLGKS